MSGPGKGLALASLALGVLGLPTAGWLGLGALAAIGLGIGSLLRARRAPTADNGRELAIAGIAAGLVSIVAAVPLVFLVMAWRESPDLWADRRILSEWPEPKTGVRPARDPGWSVALPPPPPPPPPASSSPVASARVPLPPPPPPRSTRREATPPPAAPEASAPGVQVVRVGGQIKEPRKLKDVRPVYPEIAKNARVQGIVILECRIGVDGRVEDVKVLRGIPLLDEAAVTAVRQWVYSPTLLDGRAVPVIMTVTVNFRLS